MTLIDEWPDETIAETFDQELEQRYDDTEEATLRPWAAAAIPVWSGAPA